MKKSKVVKVHRHKRRKRSGGSSIVRQHYRKLKSTSYNPTILKKGLESPWNLTRQELEQLNTTQIALILDKFFPLDMEKNDRQINDYLKELNEKIVYKKDKFDFPLFWKDLIEILTYIEYVVSNIKSGTGNRYLNYADPMRIKLIERFELDLEREKKSPQRWGPEYPLYFIHTPRYLLLKNSMILALKRKIPLSNKQIKNFLDYSIEIDGKPYFKGLDIFETQFYKVAKILKKNKKSLPEFYKNRYERIEKMAKMKRYKQTDLMGRVI
jgi:hypothetical protein